jgi:uncharacterized protein YbjT (DUF2867 family)
MPFPSQPRSKGAQGVFILPPSEFDPSPGFPEAHAVIDAVKAALGSALPGKVVCLSTIGAQASQSNLLTQRTLMDQALAKVSMPIAFLSPSWFMENAAWDVVSARDSGVIERGETGAIKGEAELATVLRTLVEQAGWSGNSNATLAA